MAPTLPLPVRVAVGLVATGWDTVRNLPSELPALSVSIAGHAVRLSMRVQQEITELAARGDELLAGVTSRPSEHPTWAHFDEDDPDASVTGGVDSASADDVARPHAQRSPFDEIELEVDVAWVVGRDEVFNDDVETEIDVSDEDFPPPHLHVVPDAPLTAADEPPLVLDERGPEPAVAVDGSEEHSAGNGAAGPSALPGYDRMTLAQVRGRLRGLTPDDVAGLLAYEQAGAGRAPFLTLLSNRIATLEHEPQ